VVRARLEGDLEGVYARPGQRVRAGELLARFEPSEEVSDARAAEADRAAARSEVSTAQWNVSRRASSSGRRDPRARPARGEQALVAARARQAATEARVRAASATLTDTRVLAPISGVIDSRQVEGNERVTRGAPLFTVVRGDVLELAASVPERQATALRAGQAVRFAAEGRQFEGKVARVSPTIDPATRSVTVFVEVPNPGGALRGNTFVTGAPWVGRSATRCWSPPPPCARCRRRRGRAHERRALADLRLPAARADGRAGAGQPGAVDEAAGRRGGGRWAARRATG
jgi:RND family efflux transporter MFP subunit